MVVYVCVYTHEGEEERAEGERRKKEGELEETN